MSRHQSTWIVAVCGISLLAGSDAPCRAGTATFDDLALAAESFENGSGLSGSFVSGGASFHNHFDSNFGSWEGFAYSNTTDVTTPGYLNQYSAYHLSEGGGDESKNYAVAFTFLAELEYAQIDLPAHTTPLSMRVTNTTYAALSMLQGDSFAKKFGGTSGDDPDWFLLTIEGVDDTEQSLGTVEFYLADYRFANNELDYLVSQWSEIDLSGLAGASALRFDLTSSDNHPIFGMNTPAFFALDNLQFWIEGDGNFDGAVTTADYTVWANHFGNNGASHLEGDYNGDGQVTTADYTVWANHFGLQEGTAAGPLPVPEPAAWQLMALAALCLCGTRRLRGSIARLPRQAVVRARW